MIYVLLLVLLGRAIFRLVLKAADKFRKFRAARERAAEQRAIIKDLEMKYGERIRDRHEKIVSAADLRFGDVIAFQIGDRQVTEKVILRYDDIVCLESDFMTVHMLDAVGFIFLFQQIPPVNFPVKEKWSVTLYKVEREIDRRKREGE